MLRRLRSRACPVSASLWLAVLNSASTLLACCPDVLHSASPAVVAMPPEDLYYFAARAGDLSLLGRQVWITPHGNLEVLDEEVFGSKPEGKPEDGWSKRVPVAGNTIKVLGGYNPSDQVVTQIAATNVERYTSLREPVDVPTVGTILTGDVWRGCYPLAGRIECRDNDRVLAAIIRRPKRPWLELEVPGDDMGVVEIGVPVVVNVRVLPGSRVVLQLRRDNGETTTLWASPSVFMPDVNHQAWPSRFREWQVPPGPLYTPTVTVRELDGGTMCGTFELIAIRDQARPPHPRDQRAWAQAVASLPQSLWNIKTLRVLLYNPPQVDWDVDTSDCARDFSAKTD